MLDDSIVESVEAIDSEWPLHPPPDSEEDLEDDHVSENEEDGTGDFEEAKVTSLTTLSVRTSKSSSNDISINSNIGIIVAHQFPKALADIGTHLNILDLPLLVSEYLHDQDVPVSNSPEIRTRIHTHRSACATFYAPSDPSGLQDIRSECIRAIESW